MEFLTANLDKILQIAMLILSSIAIRQAVAFTGQNWIKTFSHSLTLVLLPVITYTITSVISGNIALSLGMVGALSIIRFRNPVKSSFELVIYFLMITTGIAAAVSLSWLVVIVVTCISAIVGGELLNRFWLSYFGRPIYVTSFTEGNSLHTLEVLADIELDSLRDHIDLVALVVSDEGRIYRFASASKTDLLELVRTLEGTQGVQRVNFSAA